MFLHSFIVYCLPSSGNMFYPHTTEF